MMKKKFLATALSLAMAVSLLTACGGNNNDANNPSEGASGQEEKTQEESQTVSGSEEELEPVELTIWLRDAVGTDDEMVTEYINNLDAVKALNVTVKFRKSISGENAKQAADLALSTGEPCDIIFDAAWISYSTRVAEGAYIDIKPYLEKYTALKEAIPETHWKAATIDGGIYAVPTYKEAGEQWGVYLPESFIKEKNLDISKVNQLSDVTEFLQALKDDGRIPWNADYKNWIYIHRMHMFHDFSSIAADTVVVERSNPTQAVNYFETEQFKAFCELTRSWNEAGYFAKDITTRENYDDVSKDESKKGMTYVSYSPQNEVVQSQNAGFQLTPIPISDVYVTTNACMGSAFCVTSQCENPDRAVAFLEVWNTVPEVKNAICFGMEGVHYTLENGQVKQVEDVGSKWSGQNWTTGNCFISYTLVGETEDKWDVYLDWNKQAIEDPLLGFAYVSTDTSAEIAAMNAVLAEKVQALVFGMVPDIDTAIRELNEALYASGLQTVLDDAQKQLDAFHAGE